MDFAAQSVEIVSQIKSVLGVHESEIPFQLRLLQEESSLKSKELKEMRNQLLTFYLKEEAFQVPFIYQEMTQGSDLVRELSKELGKQKRNSLLVDVTEGKIYGTIFKEGISAGKVFQEHKGLLRGGGGPTSFQASVTTGQDIIQAGRRLKTIFEEVIK